MSNKSFKKKEGPVPHAPPSNDAYDLEQQLILRLPEDAAQSLRQDIGEASTVNLGNKLSIELDPDMRHGRVRYGQDIYFSKLLDLPCIIESLKTLDKKTFYKTSSICQMLVCKTEEDLSQDENESPKKKDKEKKYHWNHGLTPSLKNVRKRRFRKTLKKKYMDQPEVEKEVKRLFREDETADSVKWQVTYDTDKAESGQPEDEASTSEQGGQTAGTQDNLASEDLFGELSSSEEEEEEDKDINIMDSDGERAERGGSGGVAEAAQPGMTASQAEELRARAARLLQGLEEARARRGEVEDQLATLGEGEDGTPMQEQLNALVEQENTLERQWEDAQAMLSQ